jgi:hypothetical protein
MQKNIKNTVILFIINSLLSNIYFQLLNVNIYFAKNSGFIAPNVPAVYDVLPARIRACVARPGLAKCGWSEPWEGAKRLT